MKTIAELSTERLKAVLSRDKNIDGGHVQRLLASDCKIQMESFFEIMPGSVECEITKNNNFFDIVVRAKANRAKPLGFLSDDFF